MCVAPIRQCDGAMLILGDGDRGVLMDSWVTGEVPHREDGGGDTKEDKLGSLQLAVGLKKKWIHIPVKQKG